MISTKQFFALVAATFVAVGLRAQTPAPVVVQAAAPAAAKNTTTTTPASAEAVLSALKSLEEMKAANDAVLAKQAATLTQLDEMQKIAEQIKVYSKRG